MPLQPLSRHIAISSAWATPVGPGQARKPSYGLSLGLWVAQMIPRSRDWENSFLPGPAAPGSDDKGVDAPLLQHKAQPVSFNMEDGNEIWAHS